MAYDFTTRGSATVTVVYHYIPAGSLPPGDYTVVQTLRPPGYLDGRVSSGPTVLPDAFATRSIPVTLTAGANSVDNDFGEVRPAGLSGSVYFDADNDGTRAAGEDGVSGASVTLTGTDDLGGAVSATAVTGADGSFRFNALRPGTYALAEAPPAGFIVGKTTAGTLGGTAGPITVTGITVPVGGVGADYGFGGDRPPHFTSTLPGDVAQGAATGPLAVIPDGTAFAYQAAATDPDGDPLRYTLLAGPSGMQFDPDHPGLLTWSPGAGDEGDHRVTIRVDDQRGGSDGQDFTLRVVDGLANRPPVFTSQPVVDAYVGVPYAYHATAVDPDGDPLTFALAAGVPAGLAMPDPGPVYATAPDPNAGLLQWTPTVGQLGDHTVEVDVNDGHGHTVPQRFTVVVHQTPGNDPPRIVSTPVTSTVVGYRYHYQVVAVDAEQDPLTYSLINPPAGMTIAPHTGLINWTPTATTTGSGVEVQVQVSDPYGVSEPQDYFLRVTALNEIHGRVFNDVLDTGDPEGPSVAPTPGIVPLHFSTVPTAFDGMTAVAYNPTNNDLIASVNSDAGYSPVAFVEIRPDGTQVPFTGLSGLRDEILLSSVTAGQPGGWTVGDVFAGTGTQGEIVKVANGGRTVLDPWVTIPQETTDLPIVRASLFFDDTGRFGNDLVVVEGRSDGNFTRSASVYLINPQGQVTHLADSGLFLEGGAVVPDDPARYGPLAGTIVSCAEDVNALVSVDPEGHVSTYALGGVTEPDELHVVRPNTNFYGVNLSGGSGSLLAVPAADFAGITGDLLLDAEDVSSGTGLYDITWDGSGLVATPLTTAAGATPPANPGGWEHFVFAPAGIGPTSGTDAGDPGLPDWTVSLEDGSGEVIATTTTDRNGDYTFRDVPDGSYTVAEVPVDGWQQTAPTPAPPGTYSLTLTGAQVIAGADFGNVLSPPPAANRPPVFNTTPPVTATAGQPLRYDAKALDPDGDPVTYDLLVHPPGMAVDPATGTVVWTPTADDVGAPYALLRAVDGRGGFALQPIPLTVYPANLPPVITSRPPTRAQEGSAYQYQARAIDPDGDPVTFQLVQVLDAATGQPVTGPSFDPNRPGLLTWPAAPQGTYHVVISAADDHGGVSTPQAFDLTVASDPPGNALTITSSYPTSIRIGRTYRYQVTTNEDGLESLGYSLVSPPAGAAISADGLLTWTPTPDQAGPQSFQVVVSDRHNADAAQPVTVTVTSQPAVNHPPSIDSWPTAVAVVGRPYTFTVTGSDPDNDPLSWSLPTAPPGMVIDPATGALVWTPQADELGPQGVVIKVADGRGGAATLSVTLLVVGPGLPPAFTTAQPPDAVQGVQYADFQVQAVDPEGGAVTYLLVPGSFPAGMSIDPATGVITWPDPEPVGSASFTVQALDDQDNASVQPYTLTVHPAGSGQPPRITSGPAADGNTAVVYEYDATASDPAATFHLGTGTQGSWSIDPNTGVLHSVDPGTGQPAPEAAGTYRVTVVATNAYGSGQMTVPITVLDDTPPAFTIPDGTAYRGVPFTEAVQATAGLADDPLTYAVTEQPTLLDASGNPGTASRASAGIGASSGWFTWTPDKDDLLGTYEIQVTVTDAYGASSARTFHLAVGDDTTPPAVQIVFASDPVAPGKPTRVWVEVQDAVGVTARTLTLTDPSGGTALVALDADGFGTVTEALVGTYTASATATDAAGLTGTATATLTVTDETSAPVATLDAPADQAQVTAPTAVTGTVSDPELVDYTLSVAPVGSDTFTTFFTYYPNPDHTPADVAITDGTLGTFDPTVLADGAYVVRLAATNAGGYTAIDDHIVTVAGHLKLGNLHLSFTDLAIPLAGIPITITRTYDTLDTARRGDFGYGWTLSEGDVHLQVSQPDGTFALAGDKTPFTNGTHVEVTLPGRDPEGFTFYAYPEIYGGLFASQTFFHPTFIADAGVLDTLTVPDVELMDNGDGTYSVAEDGSPYNPAAVGNDTYTVTTRGGTAYVVDANAGTLDSVTDRNGNSLTYDADGITSSTGVRVAFHRDGQGRVDEIDDPRGNKIVYTYDPTTGDLAAVTDRAGSTTQFLYGTTPHYLDHVLDPSGRVVARISYTGGRVSGLTDAQDNTTGLSYDLSTLSETVTPPSVDGNPSQPTKVTYDALGDVISTTDALDHTTTATYDDAKLKTQTQSVGDQTLTTSYTYYPDGLVRTVTDPAGYLTSFTYNAFGQPETITNGTGDPTTLGYDGNGNLVATTTPGGVATSSTYFPDGQVHTSTTPDGTTIYAYYAAGETGGIPGAMKRVTDVRGVTTTYIYDANGNQLTSQWTWVDPRGVLPDRIMTTTNVYDANDRLIQTVDPSGTTTETVYDADGRAVWTNEPHLPGQPSVGTHVVYDADGRVIRTEQYHNVVIAITDPNSSAPTSALTAQDSNPFSVTSTVYDARGEAVWADDPHLPGSGVTVDGTLTQYDAAGNVVGTQRYANVDIEIGSDGAGAPYSYLASQPPPSALLSSTSTVYDEAGRVQQATDAANHSVTYTYDAAGNQIEADDTTEVWQDGTFVSVPRATSATYDDNGRLATSTDALGHKTTYRYDADGHLILTTYDDGTTSSATYDANGRKTSETDQDAHTTRYEYNDGHGDLTDVYLPAAPVTSNDGDLLVTWLDSPHYQYTYDSYGNLATVTDPQQHTTTYAYDAFGRKVSETLPTLPDGTAPKQTWRYNTLGQLDQVVDFDGQVTDYAYDDQGRVTEKDEYASLAAEQQGTSAAVRVVTYSYDNYDFLIGLSGFVFARYDTVTISDATNPDADGTTSTYYDAEGGVIEIDSTVGGASAVQGDIAYTYDPATGQKTGVTTANTHVTYGYDQGGRLRTVTAATLDGQALAQPQVTTYAYDKADDLAKTFLPNGTVETRGYDTLNRLTSVVTTLGDGEAAPVVASFTYTLDNAGRRLSATDADGRTVTYTYDADGRLTRETITQDPNAADRTFDYTYDAAGNRVTMSDTGGASLSYAYDADGRLTGVFGTTGGAYSSTTYTYDPAGNTKTVTATTDDGLGNQTTTTTTNTWDTEGRLVAVTTAVNGTTTGTVNDAYDDAGDRVSETVDGQKTAYLNDPNQAYDQVLEEYAPGGALAATYVRGLDLLFQDRQGARSFYVKDGLGSSRALTDSNGAVTDKYTYDAFGNDITPANQTNPTPNEYRFAGYQFDVATGLDYLQARYYDGVSGRLTSRDSYEGRTSDPLTLNHYVYVSDDPVNHIDPSGHWSLSVSLGSMEVAATVSIVGLSFVPFMSISISNLHSYNQYSNLKYSLISMITDGYAGAVAIYNTVETNAQAIERAISDAVSRAVSAGRGATSTLSRLPIFPVLKGLTPRIYDFDLYALSTNPYWFVLNYNGPNSRRTDDNRARVKAAWGRLMAAAPAGYELDEYPFASTLQGGTGALGRPVPGGEQRIQSFMLSSFYGVILKAKPRAKFLVVPIPI